MSDQEPTPPQHQPPDESRLEAKLGHLINMLQYRDEADTRREIERLRKEISALHKDIQHARDLHFLAEQEVRALKNSWSYRVGRIIVYPASIAKWLRARWIQRGMAPPRPRLLKESELTERQVENLETVYKNLEAKPKFSVIIPVYNTPPEYLAEAFDSVVEQIYPDWELCVADDASTSEATRKVLDDYQAELGDRFHFTRLAGNSGIAKASNAAAALATGDFIALLDHDDLITPDALLEMAVRINKQPDADIVYSDEDKLTLDGRLVDTFHKPDFSPEMMLSYNYMCHFTVIRKTVFDHVGGFHEGFDGSQDHDLFLRVTEVARRVEHVPKVLYHWRKIPGSTAADAAAKGGHWRDSGRNALQAALERRGWQGSVENGLTPTTYRVKLRVDDSQGVTIIIPIKDKIHLLKNCIDSIQRHTLYKNYEILVVSNNSEEKKTYEYLDARTSEGVLRYIRLDEPFNYSRLNNVAVKETNTPYLLFLNNDIEAASDGWLTALVEHVQRREIGAAGSLLLYGNGTIQHAGILMGINGIAGHAHRYLSEREDGYFSFAKIIRNYSGVTAACLLMRRDVFDEIDGFDERYAVAFNDVDLCLRIREAGYRIVYTPFSRLYHHESLSRGYDDRPEQQERFRREIALMKTTWGERLYEDPYYNPNLSLLREDFALRRPEEAEQEKIIKGSVLLKPIEETAGLKPGLRTLGDKYTKKSPAKTWADRFPAADPLENAFAAAGPWISGFSHRGHTYGAPSPLLTDRDSRVVRWDALSPFKGQRVLHLGAREGAFTKYLLELGADHVTAVEQDPTFFLKCCFVKEALELDRTTVEFSSFASALAAGERYDVVVAEDIFARTEEPLAILDLLPAVAPIICVFAPVASALSPVGEWLSMTDARGRTYTGRREYRPTPLAPEGGIWLADPDLLNAFIDRRFNLYDVHRQENERGYLVQFTAISRE